VLECWDRKHKDYVAVKIVRNVDKYRHAAMIEVRCPANSSLPLSLWLVLCTPAATHTCCAAHYCTIVCLAAVSGCCHGMLQHHVLNWFACLECGVLCGCADLLLWFVVPLLLNSWRCSTRWRRMTPSQNGGQRCCGATLLDAVAAVAAARTSARAESAVQGRSSETQQCLSQSEQWLWQSAAAAAACMRGRQPAAAAVAVVLSNLSGSWCCTG